MSARKVGSPRGHLPPLGDALQPTIDRLKVIAAQSSEALLLANGPVEPDWQLTEAAAEVISLRKRARDAREREAKVLKDGSRVRSADGHAEWMAASDERRAYDAQAEKLMHKAAKMPSTTPAGIYAKALMVRCYKGHTGILGTDLAGEIIACTALRAILWPAGEVPA